MPPKPRVSDRAPGRALVSEFLTFDQAGRIVGRPASEVRYLVGLPRVARTAVFVAFMPDAAREWRHVT
jgi:hypothetical protein